MLLNLLFASCIFLSCHDGFILDTQVIDPSVIQGDTVKNRIDKNMDFKGHPLMSRFIVTGDTVITYQGLEISKPDKDVNLQNLKNPERKDQPFRMVVFGGSLGAGVRDGGLFNEGMESSFGSLLANQMGIKFNNPLFDKQDYNGFGRLESTTFNPTGGPIPKFKRVINNTGIDGNRKETNGNIVLKSTKIQYDNYSFPYGSFISQGETESYIRGTSPNISPLIKRLNNPNISAEITKENPFDFFILEIPEMDQSILSYGLGSSVEDFQRYIYDFKEFDNGNPPTFPLGAETYELYYRNFFKKMHMIGAKGVILNLPHVYDLPFFQQNYKDKVLNVINTYQLPDIYWNGAPSELKIKTEPIGGGILFADIIFGYSGLDSLLAPNVNINLKPGISKNHPVLLGFHGQQDIENIKVQRQKYTENFNKMMQEALGYPVVDLLSIYQAISDGNYVTHDGIKVNNSWPGGNFFSLDGMHPSAFGQAVITNEIISVINKYYKLDIQYVNTREFIVNR